MKYLIVSDELDSLGVLTRLIDEGHEVKVWCKDKESHDIGSGIIRLVPNYRDHVRWADVVVVDSTGYGKEADAWRKAGILVSCGTAETDKIEDDRAYGMRVLEKHGLTVPPWVGPFKTLDQIITFVKKMPQRWVLKPSGQMDRDLTYVSRDAEDLIEEIARWKEKGLSIKQGAILQKFIKGHELAVGSPFCGTQFVTPFQVNAEHKKMFAGNLGPNTGEQGTVVAYLNRHPLIDRLKKLQLYLAGTGYSTDFDLNFMLTDTDAYVMEVTSRLGYPAVYLQTDNCTMDIGEMFYELASGTLKELPMKEIWVVGVVLSAPGYPYKESYLKHGKGKSLPMIKIDSPDHIYFYEIEKKDKKYLTTGSSGAALVICAEGSTIEQAQKKCYDFIKKQDYPSWLAYRIDIGTKFINEELSWFKSRKWW